MILFQSGLSDTNGIPPKIVFPSTSVDPVGESTLSSNGIAPTTTIVEVLSAEVPFTSTVAEQLVSFLEAVAHPEQTNAITAATTVYKGRPNRLTRSRNFHRATETVFTAGVIA